MTNEQPIQSGGVGHTAGTETTRFNACCLTCRSTVTAPVSEEECPTCRTIINPQEEQQ